MSSLALFGISHRVFIFANIFAFEYRSRTARVRLQRQRQVLGNQGADISLALAQDLGWFLVLNAEFLNAEGHLAIVGIAAASGPFGNKIGFDPLVDAGGYGLQGGGENFVVELVGSRDNVIGLPVTTVLDLLATVGPADGAWRRLPGG